MYSSGTFVGLSLNLTALFYPSVVNRPPSFPESSARRRDVAEGATQDSTVDDLTQLRHETARLKENRDSGSQADESRKGAERLEISIVRANNTG
jgi:hypothetical protein